MKKYLSFPLAIIILLLNSCDSLQQQQSKSTNQNSQRETCSQPSSISQEAVSLIDQAEMNKLEIARGQKIYVPFYSQLYQSGGLITLDLAGTLSIRNTSETDSILITSVRYYDTNGKLVKDCLAGKNLQLTAMATTEFEVARADRTGGSGANFIVEWIAEKKVSNPIVEAIMITASGTQGYTFISSGRVIEELK